jgi:hypothetical protein
METIVNKVAESGIITLDLTSLLPSEVVAIFDLKPFLFREMILREKDYRAALAVLDWEQYRNCNVAITCSADAIIPVWAYMLAASSLEPVASAVYFGTETEMINAIIQSRINAMDIEEYADKRVVIKGCGDTAIPEAAYVAITHRLRPVIKSLMYGEPCSMVPVYKKK